MHKHIINSKTGIEYNKGKKPYEEDKGYASSIYEYRYNDKWVEIMLGKPRYEFSTKGVVYNPVYTTTERGIERIGVFEMKVANMITNLDEQGEPDLSKGTVIIFRDVFIDNTDKDEPIIESDDEPTDQEVKIPVSNIVPTRSGSMPKETAKDVLRYRKEFLPSPGNTWIENIYRNNNFDIRVTSTTADSYIVAISAAMEYVGRKVTVSMMRQILHDSVTKEIYQRYALIYNELSQECLRQKHTISEARKMAGILRRRHENVYDPSARSVIVQDAKDTRTKFRNASMTHTMACRMMEKHKYMSVVKTMDDFKLVVTSPSFLLDKWAKTVIGETLNVHVVEFNGDSNDAATMISEGYCTKDADYYILLLRKGDTYDLITYKGLGAFTFAELPIQIRTDMARMCMENRAPLFSKLTALIGYAKKVDDEVDDVNYALQYGYEPNTVIMFHVHSSGGHAVGTGPGEKIQKGKEMDFSRLDMDQNYGNWRRWLDDAYAAPFVLDGKQWNTVDHYVIAQRVRGKYPDVYHTLSLDSNTKQSKTLKHAQLVVQEKCGELIRNIKDRRNALMAKFSQNAKLGQVLRDTLDAKLTKYVPKIPAQLDKDLMVVRRELQQK